MLVLAAGAGLAVASIYYSQPLLGRLAESLDTDAATIGFDFGVQATLVAHQTLVYGLEPAALRLARRGRLRRAGRAGRLGRAHGDAHTGIRFGVRLDRTGVARPVRRRAATRS